MKGFVPTPRATVDMMVELLFKEPPSKPTDSVLDPGCGTGEFIDGVIRWCRKRRISLPQITGIESDPRHLPVLREKYEHIAQVKIRHSDFLSSSRTAYKYIVGNPPYVPITGLSESEKALYRARYASARGRFDLYLLFFEEALRRLARAGRLVFITPEKYLYVDTAGPLRELLAQHHIEEILLVPEDTFGELVTYPTITVVRHAEPAKTKITRRDGTNVSVQLHKTRSSWLPLIDGVHSDKRGVTLRDACIRLSCGVATGADDVFVKSLDDLDPHLRSFAYPTIAGRELQPGKRDFTVRSVMLVPYKTDARLAPLEELGALGQYLLQPEIQRRLLARTCVKRKPWYAFHETPPLADVLRPKILCKDISQAPHFWIDRSGDVVPRHSVYYIVPRRPAAIDVLADYLRSATAGEWLRRNCQRASNGFLRLQSHVLQRLPLPNDVALATGADNASIVDSCPPTASAVEA